MEEERKKIKEKKGKKRKEEMEAGEMKIHATIECSDTMLFVRLREIREIERGQKSSGPNRELNSIYSNTLSNITARPIIGNYKETPIVYYF